uniref:Uncharacterized protein n=1 Tax=Solanum tuberosum TaxID=4113 RepID=M1DXR7_SOLTU
MPYVTRPIVAVNAADVEPNLDLSLALRNGPALSPLRNEPAPRQNEQAAAGINLVLSLATRYVPVPRPIIDQAAGTNLELSLAISSSTYGEQPSSSEIWLEDMMNVDHHMVLIKCTCCKQFCFMGLLAY